MDAGDLFISFTHKPQIPRLNALCCCSLASSDGDVRFRHKDEVTSYGDDQILARLV
ncbi:hypothetical protein AVEN_175808-1, partial [Araneus ventricosus]